MKSVTQLKSVGDIRTTISTHARSTPRLKGSTYLEVYLLDKEKQRLQTELTVLTRRQLRIQGRLGEIGMAIAKLVSQAPQDESEIPSSSAGAGEKEPVSNPGDSTPSKWRKMTIEY